MYSISRHIGSFLFCWSDYGKSSKYVIRICMWDLLSMNIFWAFLCKYHSNSIFQSVLLTQQYSIGYKRCSTSIVHKPRPFSLQLLCAMLHFDISGLHQALPHHPMPFVFFVLICDAWEICFILCKQRDKSLLTCITTSKHTDKRHGMMG